MSRIEGEGDLLPAQSDPSAPFIRKVIEACREASGKQPVIVPSSGGSGPLAPFTMPPPTGLGLAAAAFGNDCIVGEDRRTGGNVASAKTVGKTIAERAKAKGVTKVVFDRGGYIYHGRVKALADAAREAGLKF